MQRKADQINADLFPRLGIIDVELVPKITDAIGKKEVIEHAQQLLSLGANVKKLNQWLISQGLDVEPDLLEEPEPMELAPKPGEQAQPAGKAKPGDKLKLDKNSDQQPSRKKTERDFAGGSRTK